MVGHEIDGMACHIAVGHVHVCCGLDASFAFRFSELCCHGLEIDGFVHDVYRLSTLYLPGPTKARPMKTTPISMACDAPLSPSPRSRWERVATSMVKARAIAMGRKNKPSRR